MVVVVDDEPMVLELSCDFLNEAGFATSEAGSTAEALDEMAKNPVHAVILGYQVARQGWACFFAGDKKLYPKVPVVILTGSGYDEGLMLQALRNGASAYVSKDTDLENMVAAVKRLTKGAA